MKKTVEQANVQQDGYFMLGLGVLLLIGALFGAVKTLYSYFVCGTLPNIADLSTLLLWLAFCAIVRVCGSHVILAGVPIAVGRLTYRLISGRQRKQ